VKSDTRVDEIVGLCRERLDRGETFDADAVLREHPDLAPVLRERLAVLAMLHDASSRAPATSSRDAMEGATLGAYRLGAKLGEGGMGAVYRAVPLRADRATGDDFDVAVKVVHAHLLSRPGSFKRFLREAEIGRAVRHPNVVATLDADAAEVGGHVVHFLAMEFVEGQTLRQLLDELGRVPEGLCRHVGREVARGLAAIHAAGVVHRDLKPENVLITKDQIVKVMDLGVARPAGDEARLSQTGAFVGSLHYGAPEQFGRSEEIDGRADLYALGLTLYELATGRHPFADEDVRVALQRQLHEKPRPASELNPQLSPLFEELLAQLLEKDRDRRPANAADVARILDEGEESAWWRERSHAIRVETKRPLRRIRVPRETALYGRDAELVKLQAAYAKAKSGDGQVVLIEGEAGIGKSRLVDEFVALLCAGRLSGFGVPPSGGTNRGSDPDRPVPPEGGTPNTAEDVNYLFGSYPPGGAATASGAFSTAYREHLGDEDSAIRAALPQTPLLVPAFAALLRGDAAPSGAEPLTKDSLLTVFVHATRAFAAQRPTIVLIDDLHFAPEEGRALFMSIALAVPGHRVLLVGCTRPGLEEKWLRQLAAREQTTRLAVPRLGPKELVHLLRDALKSERLAEELGGLIAVKSDGNPFFVFEMLRGLKEGQFLAQRPDGTWHTTQVIRDIQIPSSILDLVNARVADLETSERDLLDVAACCGFEFDPSLVAAATGAGRVPTLKSLAQIERAHRLVRSSGRRFVFDHHQVQEALYGSLPEALREEYHAAIASAIETQHGAAGKEPKDVDGAVCVDLAEHFLKGAQGARALRYLDPALTHLEKGYLNDAAVRLADRALAEHGLLAGTVRCEVLLRRAGRLDVLGRRGEERTSLDEANALADAAADPSLRGAARTSLGVHLVRIARFAEARRVLEESLAIAKELGYRRGEAAATGNIGLALLSLGRHEDARAHFERGLVIAREIGDRFREAIATGNMGIVLRSLGRFDEARAHQERTLEIAREIGDQHGEARATGNLGSLFWSLGRFDAARAFHERYFASSREVGDRRAEAIATGNLGVVLRSLGRYDEARALFERRLALAREISDGEGEAIALADIGAMLFEQNLGAEAAAHLREAAAMAENLGVASIRLTSTARLACLGIGDRAFAVATALAALTAHEAGASAESAMDARFLLWRATGDRAHLVEAKRRLDFMVEHAPTEDRVSMLTNVRLDREIMEAAKATGL